MKKVIFLMLMAFVALQETKAQCAFYGYYVDATGFICGEDVGKLCILTSADWACNDGPYEVQITFQTGSFIYTDLGDFSVLSSNQTSTTIHAALGPISEGTTSYCLEGVIQVPGTVFSVQIVSLNDPTVIFYPRTFTLDVANVIGSNVGVPTITEAIFQQLVLDPASAESQGQRIIIDGNLQISENYTFGGAFDGSIINEIKMMPGSSIEIMGGVIFNTRRTNISGCEGQWDRIKIAPKGTYNCTTTRISEAKVGVEMLNLASLNFFNSSLYKNDIGVGSFGSNFKTIYLNFFSAALGIGNSISEGIDGCHFENVSPLTLSQVSIREMTNAGIYLDKTDLTASRIRFRKCKYGIQAATPNNLLSVSRCYFEEGDAGVLSQGSLEMQVVDNNEFINIDYAVTRTSAVPNDHTLIENNYFDYTCLYGVMGFAQPSSAEIQFNGIYTDQTNVAVFGLGTGSHKWATQYNDNMGAGLSNSNGHNVTLWNTKDARIFNNYNPYSSNYNFLVQGGSCNKIGYNRNCISDNRNIQAIGSPNGTIYCNETRGTHGITILNDCAGTEIRGNDMTGGAENLVYGSPNNGYANTGAQLYKGNIFDLSSEKMPKAVNFSSEPIAAMNQYKVGSSAEEQGTILYPFFTSSFDEWFKQDENDNDYICPRMAIYENQKEKELAKSIDANIRVLESGLEQTYGKDVAFDAHLKLYRDLFELNQLIGLDLEQQSWFQERSNSNAAKFVAFENVFQSATQLTEGEVTNLQALSQAVQGLNQQINSIALYEFDPAKEKGYVNQVQLAQYEALILARDQAVEKISHILMPKRQSLIEKLPAMKSILDGISDLELQSVQNLRQANFYFLRRLQPDFRGFSESERLELKFISEQCASTGGEGVYIARVLLAESTFNIPVYNDECLPAIQTQQRGATSTAFEASEGFLVTPNPTNETAIIYLPQSSNVRMLTITDLYGSQVYSTQIGADVRQQPLVTADITPGIYFVRVSGLRQTIKLIITR